MLIYDSLKKCEISVDFKSFLNERTVYKAQRMNRYSVISVESVFDIEFFNHFEEFIKKTNLIFFEKKVSGEESFHFRNKDEIAFKSISDSRFPDLDNFCMLYREKILLAHKIYEISKEINVQIIHINFNKGPLVSILLENVNDPYILNKLGSCDNIKIEDFKSLIGEIHNH